MRTSSTFQFAAVIGHQGGWDEALLVVTPMLFVGWLLWVAKRRMERRSTTSTDAGDEASSPSGERSEPFDTGAD